MKKSLLIMTLPLLLIASCGEDSSVTSPSLVSTPASDTKETPYVELTDEEFYQKATANKKDGDPFYDFKVIQKADITYTDPMYGNSSATEEFTLEVDDAVLGHLKDTYTQYNQDQISEY